MRKREDGSGIVWLWIIALLASLFLTACAGERQLSDGEAGQGGVEENSIEGWVERPPVRVTEPEEEWKELVRLGLLETSALEQPDREGAWENVRPAMVRLTAGGHYATGCIWEITEENIYIVSNRHALEYWDEDGRIEFYEGSVVPGEMIGLSDVRDVGLLQVAVSGVGLQTARGLRFVRADEEAYRQLREGSEIFSAGASSPGENGGEAMEMAEGSVIDPWWYLGEFSGEMIYARGYGHPGMSGGGTFDCHGNFVGLLSGGTQEGETASLPLPVIVEEVEEILNNR